MIPTPPLGMDTRSCDHCHAGCGDLVNCVRGDVLRGGTGVIIAGALLLFLWRPKIRDSFV